MKNIGKERKNIWFGIIKNIGGFIYDEKFQEGVEKSKVKIYLLDHKQPSTYLKEILKKKLIKLNEKLEFEYLNLINNYLEINDKKTSKIQVRKADCFECKEELNSVDDEICKECNWIKCDCGACGCGWENYEIN